MSRNDVIVHEEWDRQKVITDANDIALIRLPHPAVTVNEGDDGTIVLPICLQWQQSVSVNE